MFAISLMILNGIYCIYKMLFSPPLPKHFGINCSQFQKSLPFSLCREDSGKSECFSIAALCEAEDGTEDNVPLSSSALLGHLTDLSSCTKILTQSTLGLIQILLGNDFTIQMIFKVILTLPYFIIYLVWFTFFSSRQVHSRKILSPK